MKEYKRYSSGCTLDCFDCCKLNVYKYNNGTLKIEGDKDHPFTKGFICKKGLAHKDFINHEKRIKKPLVKINGKWSEITFDECINIFVEKLKLYKNKEILYYEQYGNGGLLKSIGDIFFNFYGGSLKQKGGPCWSAGMKAQKYDFGTALSHSLEDMQNSKNIFVWGKNPRNTSIHTMKAILDAKKLGRKIIVIDPIKTKTADIGDIHVGINPGSDYYLALAMGKLILEKNLQDNEFIKMHVDNFNEYKNFLENVDIDTLLERTGIKLSLLEELVNLYTEKYSSIYLGYGMQKYKDGGKCVRAIDALGAITGQIGFSGGGVNYANKLYGSLLDLDPYKSFEKCTNIEFEVGNIKNTIKENNVKMMVITKSNMLNQLPNINKLKEEMKRVDFKVCFDLFMTDTAKECDLFIPSTATLESEDLLYSSMTNPYLIYKEKVVEPENKLMDEYEFFNEVAKRLNLRNYPIDVDKKKYINKVLKPLNITVDDLKNGYITREIKVPWSDFKFKTDTGNFKIGKFNILEKEKEEDYRLITTHIKDSLSSQHFIDVLEKALFYINEKEGQKLNLKDGEKAKLKSKNGHITAICRIDNRIKDKVAMMEVGWHSISGNPNCLTEDYVSDIGGQIAYNETRVKIEK